MLWNHQAATNIGSRSENQDSYCIRREKYANVDVYMYAVIDGMGGHADGKEAANLIMQAFLDYSMPEYLQGGDLLKVHTQNALITEMFQDAVRALDSLGPSNAGACATLLLVVEDLIKNTTKLVIGWAGDVRVYAWGPRSGVGVNLLTFDHNIHYCTTMPGGPYNHRMDPVARSPITMGLMARDSGMQRMPVGFPQIEHYVFTNGQCPYTRMLVCSDGLYGQIDTAAMQVLMAASSTTLADMIALAAKCDESDNITGILIER